jgi:hypothetical protein
MRPKLQKRSALKFTGRIIPRSSGNETQASETKCTEACWSNYPAKQGYNTPLQTLKIFPKPIFAYVPVIGSYSGIEPDKKDASLSGNRFHPDEPAVFFDNFLAYCQSEPGASFFGREKRFENVF